jgi:photosystem II stability/assembly factor-like uncharacterized protein
MRTTFVFVLVLVAVVLCGSAQGFEGFIGLREGYFYDKATGESWVPHGIAYQTWNRPLGVWQTFEQIDYDLDEMVKMGANSVRIDIVWQHAEEDGPGQFKWENYDYFINACEQRGLRIFALVGYQWPPNWFPDEWYTQHPPEFDSEGLYHPERWQSDIINFEHPDARAAYESWIQAVCDRYKNEKAIVGWIVGNEYGYLGLWSGLLDGYDPETEQAFRNWCQAKYGTIAAANAAWGSTYTNFSQIKFVEQYRAYGLEGAIWADMVQFREDSVADFTALSAAAAKSVNTNHLISYSTVGMQWGEEDWRYHAEDRGKITAYAALRGAPIDFFSVNNYPWSVLGHESQQGHWGITYTKKVAKVPVLYSETGFTSSETMWPGMNEFRQGPLIRNALWESLQAGAIGTHVFSWQDRPWITDREKGFGILYADRRAKPALWTTREAYTLMQQAKINELLAGSKDPTPDIAFLWTDANDSQYNRYECEMQQIAGALERLGFEPGFIDLQELASGVYTNFKMIILPRNMRVEETVPGSGKTMLNFLRENVIGAGVHVLASADIPGLQNPNAQWRAQAVAENSALFGIDASDIGGFEAPQRTKHYVSWYWKLLEVDFNSNATINGYHYWPQVWKYNDEIRVTNNGQLWATFNTTDRNKGYEDDNSSLIKWDGVWGDVYVRSGWGWAYDGNNMVQMWGDSGMWQDWDVVPFGKYTHSAYLRSNTDDALRNGKRAYVAIEWYDYADNLLGSAESTHLTNSTGNQWVQYKVEGIAPSNTWYARRIVRITGAGDGSVYVDNPVKSPAVVVKNHGTAKSAIFLYSAGDQKPDATLDGDPDVYAWQWRYDTFGAIVKDYFGIQPRIEVTGANAYLCLADFRTLADGATLWQVKNYMYDTNYPASYEDLGGGPPQTFTISSSMFQGKTVEALLAGRVIEANCDGTITLTIEPDGMEMLYVYDSITSAGEYTVGSSDGRMWGMNNTRTMSTGEGPASFPLSNVYTTYYSYARAPIVAGDRMYAVENYFAHMIGCWDARTGSNLWHFTSTNGTVDSFYSRSLAVADGTLFVATKNISHTNLFGALWAFDAMTGELRWRYVNPLGYYNAVPPVIRDGIVYSAFVGDQVRAFYADTGALKWASTNVGGASAYAGLALDGNIIYHLYAGNLYGLNAETGSQLFRVSVGRPSYAESAPVVSDGRVYVARNHMTTGVGVYNATNGALLWNYPGISLNKFAAPAVHGNRMYIVGQATNEIGVTRLFAFDSTQAGAPLWTYLIPETAYLDVTPLVANGAVYMNANTNLFIVNATSGALIQTVPHYGETGEPFVKNGWVFVPHGSGRIEALSDGSPWPSSGGIGNSDAGYWKLDEDGWTGAAGEVKDSSVNANHGRAYNGPTTTWDAKRGKAGYFDGVNDYVEIPNSASLQVAGDMTLSFWFRPENLGSARINPVDKSYGGEFGLTIETSSSMNYYHGTARTGGKYWSWAAFTNGTLKNGEWQHVVITRKASTRELKSYLNGKLMRTATYPNDTNTMPAASTYPVRIAQGYTGARMKGAMDEVRIVPQTLSDAAIRAEYAGRTLPLVLTIKDAPALVHPMGDKTYSVKVRYDTLDAGELTLRLAFMEKGDNGDGTPDEIYEQLEELVAGNGMKEFFIWIPDADVNDPDYISTPDGGSYQFLAWLEDAEGNRVVQALPQDVQLEWGVRPTAALPVSLSKGDEFSVPIEWENLYEHLPWETTPLTRNEAFPSRVALFRSLKTEAQFPGQLDKCNAVADWLESMGYEAGNPLDISFDNVKMNGVFTADFESGMATGWGSGLEYTKNTTYALNAAARRVSYKVVADASKTISKISIHAAAFGTCPTYALAIYADDGSGKPTGSPLVSQNFTHTGTAYTWKEIAIPSFTWTKGTTYHIVILYVSGTVNSSNYLGLYYIGPDTAGRKILVSTNTGSTWTEQTFEPTFLLQYTDGSRFDQPYCSVSAATITTTAWYGEKFTRFSSLTVKDITVMLRAAAAGSTGAIEVNIRRWSDKSLVATATMATPALTTTYTWKTFTFSAPAHLEAGVPYYFEIKRIGAGSGTYYVARPNTLGSVGHLSWGGTDNYTIYSSNSGGTWSAQNQYDLGFMFNGAGWNRIAGAANWTIESSERATEWGSGLVYDKNTAYSLNAAATRLSYKVVADASKTISSVSLYASVVGTSPTYTLAIYADDGNGKPTGAPLVSQNFTHSGTSYVWKEIAIPAFAWTKGVTYHIVVQYASGTINASNYLRVQYAGPDSPGRKVLTSTNGGSTWTELTFEPTFRLKYADETTFNQPYASVSAVSFNGATWRGQKFTPVYSLSVSDITMKLRSASAGDTGAIELNIRRWSDKSLVATTTLATPALTTTFGWRTFTFGTPAELQAGTTYYYELKRIGGSGTYYAARANTLGSLGTLSWGGLEDCAVYTTTSGSTWTSETHYDMGFVLNAVANQNALRVSRVGNSDNMFAVSEMTMSDGLVSADIMYNKQGPYFNDAELYFRFVDRDNFYKVGFRNFYGFWRIMYQVRYQGSLHAIGIIHNFNKVTRPVEGEWYNLAVKADGDNFTVYLDGEAVGSFSSSLIPSGSVAVGASATQLGIWEPQKGYFFIDDDEYSYYAPEGQPTPTNAALLNLDWGYLDAFYPTLILPSTYVMSDVEVSNVITWIGRGLRNLIATDGGIAMKKPDGANGSGRIESLFGVAAVTTNVTGLTGVTIANVDHYVTHEYDVGNVISASGSANAWPLVTKGIGLGVEANGGVTAPALIANVITNDPLSPKKVFCFNFGVDTEGQLTGSFAQVAQRAFEWARGQAYKVRLELKYSLSAEDPGLDLALLTRDIWLIAGTGMDSIDVSIPESGIMTGDNLYWVLYVYPWDAQDPWLGHGGFYTSANDNNATPVSLAGKGLQIFGMTGNAYAGRDWDMWAGYNTRGVTNYVTFGVKAKGSLLDEDNFDDGNYTGWTVTPHANIAWTVTNGALRASVVSTGGYSYITRNGLDVSGENITIEYDVFFDNGAQHGGMVYRGRVLYVNPLIAGWEDNSPFYYSNTRITTGKWHHVTVNIRDGNYMMSDLYVDGMPVFLSEPIQVSSYSSTTVGFLSPYSVGRVSWDNFRLSDEAYSFVSEVVSGEFVPTNAAQPTFWPSIPDYDPDFWEFDGTRMGGQYEWYVFLRGEGISAYSNVNVYFAPRLMVETPSFPTQMTAGTVVNVPVEWEELGTNAPTRLSIALQNAKTGVKYAEATYTILDETGSGSFPVTVPSYIPSGSDFLWAAYMAPPTATNPWLQRVGFDDTYRGDSNRVPIAPETQLRVTNAAGGAYVAYADIGIPVSAQSFVWGGVHDGQYMNGFAPEGSNFWRTTVPYSYAGWGVYHTQGNVDLSQFKYLKFWIKAWRPIKIELEAPQGTKRIMMLCSSVWNPALAGQWQEVTIPLTNFGFPGPLTNVYGTFGSTLHVPNPKAISFISTNAGWMAGYMYDGTRNISTIMKTSGNGGATNWAFQTPGTNYEVASFYDVDFVDANRGWIAAYNKGILRTTNGGAAWFPATNGLNGSSINSLDFVDANTGWAYDWSQKRMYKTVNGGATWTQQVITFTIPNTYLYKTRFANANVGYSVGGDWSWATGRVMRTANGGATWTEVIVGTNMLNDVFVLDANNAFVCGERGAIFKTTDGGANWTSIRLPSSDYLYSTCWQNTQTGWVGGGNGTMYRTTNGGATWESRWCGFYGTIADMQSFNGNTMFVALDTPYNTAGVLKSTNIQDAYPTWTRMNADANEYQVDFVRWTVNP